MADRAHATRKGALTARRALQRASPRSSALALRRARAKKRPASAQETEADKKFTEALELYTQLYPNDPELPELLFRQGKLYYDYGVYDAAVKIWGLAAREVPAQPVRARPPASSSSTRSTARRTTRTSRRGRAGSRRAPAFQRGEQQKKLDTLIVQAVFKQGEQKAAAGRPRRRGGGLPARGEGVPEATRAPAQACVNAELEAQKAGDIATMKEAAKLVTGKDVRDAPESPHGAWIAATHVPVDGALRRVGRVPRGDRGLADAITRTTRSTSTRRTRRSTPSCSASRPGEHDKAIAERQPLPRAVRHERPTPTRSSSRWARRTRTPGRTRRPPISIAATLARSKNQDHRVQGYVLLAHRARQERRRRRAPTRRSRTPSTSASIASASSGPTASTPRRTRATWRASASSTSSTRSKSRAT